VHKINTFNTISIKSTLNKTQFSTQLILVLKFHKKICIDTLEVIKLQIDTSSKFWINTILRQNSIKICVLALIFSVDTQIMMEFYYLM
jgi:hypothetical protein